MASRLNPCLSFNGNARQASSLAGGEQRQLVPGAGELDRRMPPGHRVDADQPVPVQQADRDRVAYIGSQPVREARTGAAQLTFQLVVVPSRQTRWPSRYRLSSVRSRAPQFTSSVTSRCVGGGGIAWSVHRVAAERLPAVDLDQISVDVARLVGGQEHRELGDIVHLAPPLERD